MPESDETHAHEMQDVKPDAEEENKPEDQAEQHLKPDDLAGMAQHFSLVSVVPLPHM